MLKWAIFDPLTRYFYCFTNHSIIMGKVTSLYGKTTGKIGSIVFSTSGGETIAREYNPNVSNPSTPAQVNQRARLKLMSQLSAALAPVIAIPKQGLVSARNAFTKLNFEQSMAQNGVAQITYENVQLTNGNLGLPTIEATRAQGSGISINLAEDASMAVSRVVYILYRKTSEQRLQFVSSVIAESAGGNGNFPATLPYTEGDIVLYAYGMRDTSESASAKYGNMQVANALDVARLTSYRNISSEDYQFTVTRGATMYANQSEITPVPEGSARVFVTALGDGSVSGGGVYVVGENATVVATANAGSHFVGWRTQQSTDIISTDASYTFEVQGTADLIAVFVQDLPGQNYSVNIRKGTNAASAGTLVAINDGTPAANASLSIAAGQSVTIHATSGTQQGSTFSGWRNEGSGSSSAYISTEADYTFTPSGNISLIAVWEQGGL